MTAETRWLVRRPVAHRGLHDLAGGVPENSLPAFEHAADRGFPIELDVRSLKDGALVVFHDASLERAAGVPESIGAQDRESLKRFRLYGTGERIPLFEDVLDAVGGRVPLLIEIKTSRAPGITERSVLDALRGRSGQFAVQSFSPRCLAWFHRHAPGLARGQIAGDLRGPGPGYNTIERYLLLHLLLNRISVPDFIAYDLRYVERRALRVWRQRGVPALAWTVRNPEDERRARGYCDNIIFESYLPS